MVGTPKPGEVVMTIGADTCERIFHAALAEGDAKGVDAALRVMVTQDPRRAERLYGELRAALAIATKVKGTA